MPNYVHTPLSRQKEIEANYERWRRAKPTDQSFPDIKRNLTIGEIQMASKIFKGSIIYNNVQIIRGGLLGLPNSTGNAMTPFGSIHMPNRHYDENLDFSLRGNDAKIWFIHEMAHVWQRRLGYPLVRCAIGTAITGGYSSLWDAYAYDLLGKDKGKLLGQFNHEQQAAMIAHYYSLQYLNYVPHKFDTNQRNELYSVLKDFIQDPTKKSLLAPDIPFSPL